MNTILPTMFLFANARGADCIWTATSEPVEVSYLSKYIICVTESSSADECRNMCSSIILIKHYVLSTELISTFCLDINVNTD